MTTTNEAYKQFDPSNLSASERLEWANEFNRFLHLSKESYFLHLSKESYISSGQPHEKLFSCATEYLLLSQKTSYQVNFIITEALLTLHSQVENNAFLCREQKGVGICAGVEMNLANFFPADEENPEQAAFNSTLINFTKFSWRTCRTQLFTFWPVFQKQEAEAKGKVWPSYPVPSPDPNLDNRDYYAGLTLGSNMYEGEYGESRKDLLKFLCWHYWSELNRTGLN